MLKRRYVHTPATWQPFGMLGSGSTLISQEKDHSGQLVGGLGPSPRGKPPSNNPFDKGIQSESKPHTQLSQETLKKTKEGSDSGEIATGFMDIEFLTPCMICTWKIWIPPSQQQSPSGLLHVCQIGRGSMPNCIHMEVSIEIMDKPSGLKEL